MSTVTDIGQMKQTRNIENDPIPLDPFTSLIHRASRMIQRMIKETANAEFVVSLNSLEYQLMKIAIHQGPRDLRIEEQALDTANLARDQIWVETEISALRIGTDRGNHAGAEQLPGAGVA